MRTMTLVLIAALLLVPAAMPTAAARCYWNPEYMEPIETASGGIVEFIDGPVCFVKVHRPT